MKLEALHRSLKHPLVIALLAGSLAGCGGKVATAPGSSNAEVVAVNMTLAGMPDMVSDDVFGVSTSTAVTASQTSNGALAAITPLFFWRHILTDSPRFDVVFADTDSVGRPRTALVVVNRRFLGTFNIVPGTGDPVVPDSAHLVHKPLDDQWVRHLLLHRFPEGGADHGWHVVAATGVNVTSHNATSAIQSVRVQTSEKDTLITDPLQLFAVGNCLRLAPGDSLVLTATTSRTDDVVLAYWHDHRERFRNNGDGTYSFTLHPADASGYRFFGVNALSRGTLFDDALPYDSNAWIIHCLIGPPPTVQYYE
jgi:hypothetical protein